MTGRRRRCVVRAGPGTTKFASFDDRHWHNECFVCSKCHVSLVGQGFLLDGLDIICTGCVPAWLAILLGTLDYVVINRCSTLFCYMGIVCWSLSNHKADSLVKDIVKNHLSLIKTVCLGPYTFVKIIWPHFYFYLVFITHTGFFNFSVRFSLFWSKITYITTHIVSSTLEIVCNLFVIANRVSWLCRIKISTKPEFLKCETLF